MGRVTHAAAWGDFQTAHWQISPCVGAQGPGEESALLQLHQCFSGPASSDGIDGTFGNLPRGWMWVQAAGLCASLWRDIPVLNPWESHPTLSQCERCLMLESSRSQTPGAEIPSVPWGNFAQGLPSPTGSARSPDPSPPLLPRPGAQLPFLGSWGFSGSLTPKWLKLPILSEPLRIHLLIPIPVRYLALAVQPVVPAACSDLDLSDCQ